MATGWLNWSPEVALTTPIGQIDLALAGRVDFLKKTNPWGAKDPKEEDAEKLLAEPPDPVAAAEQLKAFVKRRQANDARHKPKK